MCLGVVLRRVFYMYFPRDYRLFLLFICLFAQKKRSTSAMTLGSGISSRAKQYSPPPVAVSGFVVNLSYSCHTCLILGTCT